MSTSISDHIEIHFDVPNSMISTKTLADVADGLQQITDSVFEEAVEPGKKAEVYLCIPRQGCFEAIFKIVAPILGGALVGIVGKTFINTFLKNMIGVDLSELTDFGTTQLTDDIKKNYIIDYTSTAISVYISKKTNSVDTSDKFDKEFKTIQKGKNTIYKAISADERIARISYNGDKYIEREVFSDFITEIQDDDDSLGQFGYYEGGVKIISPVSLKEKSRRGWTGLFLAEGEQRIERTFEIDDENFRQYIITNNIRLAADDIAEVQMIKDSAQTPQWRVLKVLKFGGTQISTPFTTEELKELSIKPITSQSQLNILDLL